MKPARRAAVCLLLAALAVAGSAASVTPKSGQRVQTRVLRGSGGRGRAAAPLPNAGPRGGSARNTAAGKTAAERDAEAEARRREFERRLVREHASRSARSQALPGRCPPEMVRVLDYCVDRWESSFVDNATGAELSPYYPPAPLLLRRVFETWSAERSTAGDERAAGFPLPWVPVVQRGEFKGKAVARPKVVPQGSLTYYLARDACAAAGKRLCEETEWELACRGERQTRYPYGPTYKPGVCNVLRLMHPAAWLHGHASVGHSDPRLNLLVEANAGPLLRLTGDTPTCASRWGGDAIYDMVGNLDEWVADPTGVFRGGFFARSTESGCAATISGHAPAYYDYSLGTRCCRSL